MISKLNDARQREIREMRLRRLALIKERYRKLILEPRKQIEFEMASDMGEEEVEFDFSN